MGEELDNMLGGGVEGGPAAPEEKPGEATAAAAESEPEPAWMETAPAEFKSVLSHSNVSEASKKFLRDTYGELNDFRATPYGTKEALQELLELYPGGLEDLRSASEIVAAQQKEQRAFELGDPDAIAQLSADRLVANSDQFIARLNTDIQTLKDCNLIQEYEAVASGFAKDRLDTVSEGKFEGFADDLAEMARKYNEMPDKGLGGSATLGGANRLARAFFWPVLGIKEDKLGYGAPTGQPTAVGARPAVAGSAHCRNRSGKSNRHSGIQAL